MFPTLMQDGRMSGGGEGSEENGTPILLSSGSGKNASFCMETSFSHLRMKSTTFGCNAASDAPYFIHLSTCEVSGT